MIKKIPPNEKKGWDSGNGGHKTCDLHSKMFRGKAKVSPLRSINSVFISNNNNDLAVLII